MEKQLISLPTKLWHPYRKPEGNNEDFYQGIADNEDYFANSQNYLRHDLGQITSGL